jgi:hypothetical protein
MAQCRKVVAQFGERGLHRIVIRYRVESEARVVLPLRTRVSTMTIEFRRVSGLEVATKTQALPNER